MIKLLKDAGNWIRSIFGWTALVTAIAPTTLVAISGFYEKIGFAASITLTVTTLAGGVWLSLGAIKLYEFLFPPKRPIPLLELIKKAEKSGWRFYDESIEIIDLMDALRDAGRNGDIIFKGKKGELNGSDIITRNKPFIEIPKEEWDCLHIDWMKALVIDGRTVMGFEKNNYTLQAYIMGSMALNNEHSYKDLHVVVPNMTKWLKIAKNDFSGRRKIQNEESKRHWDAMANETPPPRCSP